MTLLMNLYALTSFTLARGGLRALSALVPVVLFLLSWRKLQKEHEKEGRLRELRGGDDDPSGSSQTARPAKLSAVTAIRRLMSEDRIRALLACVRRYAAANGGALPASLEDLRGYAAAADGEGQALDADVDAGFTDGAGANERFDLYTTNPLTGARPGYVYARPPGAALLAEAAAPSALPLVFELTEDGRPDPDGAVGYADGRVERTARPWVGDQWVTGPAPV